MEACEEENGEGVRRRSGDVFMGRRGGEEEAMVDFGRSVFKEEDVEAGGFEVVVEAVIARRIFLGFS